jgi:phosphate:Na+ symporter
VTGLIAIIFIYQLVNAVDRVSDFVGIRADDFTLKLAVFHTIFNLIGVIVMLPLIRPLVTFLQRLFKEKKPEIDQPKYLTNSALDFPDTTVKVALQETEHIYDNALNIIIHGLGFLKEQVFAEVSLEDIASHQGKVTKLDIDSAYNRGVKGVYSAIIEFISKADFSWKEEQSGELHHLREANQYIVEAIKDVKHLQKNLLFYVNGEIVAMRNAYNQLRVEILTVVRDLNEIRTTDNNDTDILSLDALKIMVKESQQELTSNVSTLIRSGKISPNMGTSLMNDSNYVYDISMNLIRAAETLFVGSERAITQAARSVSLDEQELQTVATQTQSDKTSPEASQ